MTKRKEKNVLTTGNIKKNQTPYERLARLNKHRNVEITSPSEANDFVSHEKKSHKNVTIATGSSATRIIHYEVETEEEYETGDEDEDEEVDDIKYEDGFEDAHQDTVESTDPYHPQQQYRHHSEQGREHHSELLTAPKEIASEPAEALRVFAGNIGQGPLFHTFSTNLCTTADALVREAATRFDLYNRPEYTEGTIEYYIAVQGLDGGNTPS